MQEPKQATRYLLRSIHHVYMDRVHLLKQHFGLEVDALKARLGIIQALADRWKSPDIDALHNGMLFELVVATGDIPGAGWVPDVPRGLPRDQGDGEAESVGALHWAQLALPILVDHVRRQTDDELVPLTYEQLAERLGRLNRHGQAWARGLGLPLGVVTRLVEAATVDWPEAEKPPYLTTIVVSKSGTDAGLPDTGIKGRWPWFNELTSEEKRARVRDEYRRIMAYGERWLDVLDRAGLSLLPEGEPPQDAGQGDVDGRGGWGGGESPEHLAFKQYALAHPELFDAPTSSKGTVGDVPHQAVAETVRLKSWTGWQRTTKANHSRSLTTAIAAEGSCSAITFQKAPFMGVSSSVRPALDSRWTTWMMSWLRLSGRYDHYRR